MKQKYLVPECEEFFCEIPVPLCQSARSTEDVEVSNNSYDDGDFS